MNLFPIFVAAVFGVITLVAGIFFRRWLVAVWIFSVLVLPLIRFHLGAPIYVMDVCSVLLLWQMAARRGWLLPFRVMPWPWLFMGLAFASTVASGFLLFGFHPEQLWIWGHYSLSCLPLVFAMVIRDDADDYYTIPLITGLTASLVVLAAIGIIQHFDLPGREQIRDLFYSHFDSSSQDVARAVEQMWENKETQVTRAPGPHFSLRLWRHHLAWVSRISPTPTRQLQSLHLSGNGQRGISRFDQRDKVGPRGFGCGYDRVSIAWEPSTTLESFRAPKRCRTGGCNFYRQLS